MSPFQIRLREDFCEPIELGLRSLVLLENNPHKNPHKNLMKIFMKVKLEKKTCTNYFFMNFLL